MNGADLSPEHVSLLVQLREAVPPAGDVVAVNRGAEPVRLWKGGNSWGDEALWFELLREGTPARLVQRNQGYTRNFPASRLVAPGDSQRWPFDLGDGTWVAVPPEADPPGPGARLVAVYDAGSSPEAASEGLSGGTLRSQPFEVVA